MRAGRERRSEARSAGTQDGGARRGGHEVPEALRRRFEQFRAQSAPRTRIPQTLRRAVLDAVAQGVSMQAVHRELGLTDKQLQSWRRRGSAPEVRTAAAATGLPSARAFKVVDPPMSGESTRVDDSISSVVAGEALELRLGGWSLVIRATGK